MTREERILIERAARAAGHRYRTAPACDEGIILEDGSIWNPLKNNNDLIGLILALGISFRFVSTYQEGIEAYDGINPACYEVLIDARSLNLAIVRCAAQR